MATNPTGDARIKQLAGEIDQRATDYTKQVMFTIDFSVEKAGVNAEQMDAIFTTIVEQLKAAYTAGFLACHIENHRDRSESA